MKKLVLLAAAATIISSSCGTKQKEDKTADEPVRSDSTLIAKLQKMQEAKQFAVGHHDDPVYGHNWAYMADSSDVKSVTGSYPAIFDWDLGHIEWGNDKQLDGVPFEDIRKYAIFLNEQGGINTFSWHPRNPVTKGDAWDVSDTTVVAQILAPGALNDTIKAWVGNVAEFIGSLKDTDGNRIPVVFRPWHEQTGSWFWWGEKLCTPEQYKDLWKLTREVFDQKGVDNVVWAYSPGTEPKTVEEYLVRYPGDEYIDIVGGDSYDYRAPDGSTNYPQNLGKMLAVADSVATTHNKVLALTETGFEGIKDPKWFTETLYPVIKDYPIAYVVFWRNAHDKPEHYYTPYPGHPAAENFVEFYNLPATIFLNDINK